VGVQGGAVGLCGLGQAAVAVPVTSFQDVQHVAVLVHRPPQVVGLGSTVGPLAADALALARRFRDHEDTILRFVADLTVPLVTNNQAEETFDPVKIQQRTSGDTWRALAGLADFAVVQSYLSTATKWRLDTLNVLTQLFTD
jgi:hypothetical protein